MGCDLKAVEILLALGANIDHSGHDHLGFTPLAAAAAAENLKVCTFLLTAGANGSYADTLISGSNCPLQDKIRGFIGRAIKIRGVIGEAKRRNDQLPMKLST